MQNVNYILCADYILTMNSQMDVIKQGAIAVDANKIIDLGSKEEILKKYSANKVFDKKNHVIMPGLINTHTHAAMVYFRGIADDLLLKEWLEQHIWPVEKKMLSPNFVYDATKLACLEMLKGGITTFVDMYFYESHVAKATKKMQMRGVIGPTILNFATAAAKDNKEYLANAERFILEWKGDRLIIPQIAPHSLYACDLTILKDVIKLARKHDAPLHIHLSEPEWEPRFVLEKTGKRPVEYLLDIGFFEGITTAAHGIWLTDNEIEILAKHNVGVSHCVESNLKMAAGFAPVVKMVNAGVKVTFGTDSAVSNNDLNIFSEMSLAAKLHKTLEKDPTALKAKTVLTMATKIAADSLGMGDKLGILEKDYLADLICINLKTPHSVPLYDIYSHLVYAACATDVETVMIDGKLILDNRMTLSCSEDDIINTALEWQGKIINN